ncbi:MAG TPA: metallophosphoesterase, partial [Methanoregula sp.]|nr:metallophosphoesterase [Methanoregula sp.]
VPPENHVFFLGDLCYGPGARPAKEYLAKLNGRVAIIRGNHDIAIPESVRSAELSYGGIRFFITHDPADAPKDFDGWVIHGHHHNNSLAQYPFISFGHRRINVSAETLGYVPITLRELCARIGDSGGLETPPVLLRYPYVR